MKSDIVCTNPPFSLFREYIEQLVEHKKKFLILGNNGAISYENIFKYFMTNNIWTGFNYNKTLEFRVPDNYKFSREDETGKYGKVPAISWFTNLEIKKKPNIPILIKKYNPKDYPQYDNYAAINVNKVKDIPYDYQGVMGVPITILGLQYSDGYIHLLDELSNEMKYEIVGAMTTTGITEFNFGYPYINGKKIYARLLIKKI